MKASELRIGNFVNFKNREDIDYCEVTSLDTGGYIHLLRNFKDGDGDDQPESIDDITPIVITEHWLERLGFSKSSLNYFHPSDKFSHITPDAYYYNGNFGYCLHDERGIFLEIKYVHQLQNLFYIMTNEELSLKKIPA